MGEIKLSNLTIYAYHGCFSEERKIGAEYKLDLWVTGDFALAEQTDNLSKTVDYVQVSDVVSKEMGVPSKLIEHVAARIVSKIFTEFSQIETVAIIIKKPNPPMNSYADSVEYRLEKTRQNNP